MANADIRGGSVVRGPETNVKWSEPAKKVKVWVRLEAATLTSHCFSESGRCKRIIIFFSRTRLRRAAAELRTSRGRRSWWDWAVRRGCPGTSSSWPPDTRRTSYSRRVSDRRSPCRTDSVEVASWRAASRFPRSVCRSACLLYTSDAADE